MKDGYLIARTIDNSNTILLNRLKSGTVESEGSSFQKWFYDLTWFNVAITYNIDGSAISNISISSYYSGARLYEYTQLSSSSSNTGSIISFSIVGKESKTYTIMGVSFTESRSVNASGNFNTDSGTGAISLSGNGYWFQD